MSVDVRDIFFQKDPFKYYNINKSFLGVALEDGTLSEVRNKKWIIRAYGKDFHKTIKHKRIICVGTIWGTIDKFIDFSKEMWKRLDSKWSLKLRVIEQAVGNYIIYHDKMFKDCLIKSENKDGPIMTIKLTKNKNIYFDLNDNVLNMKGEVASVVHQYDRKSYIVRKVINKYCPEIINNKFISYSIIIIIFCLLFKSNLRKNCSNRYNILKMYEMENRCKDKDNFQDLENYSLK